MVRAKSSSEIIRYPLIISSRTHFVFKVKSKCIVLLVELGFDRSLDLGVDSPFGLCAERLRLVVVIVVPISNCVRVDRRSSADVSNDPWFMFPNNLARTPDSEEKRGFRSSRALTSS